MARVLARPSEMSIIAVAMGSQHRPEKYGLGLASDPAAWIERLPRLQPANAARPPSVP